MLRTSIESGIPHTAYYMVKEGPLQVQTVRMQSMYAPYPGSAREKGKDALRAVEAINLGLASDRNTSASKLYIPSTRQIIVTNQMVLDESLFLVSKEELIRQLDEGDDELDILY